LKKIIIGDVKFPDQKWIIDYFKEEFIWFYIDHAVIGNPYGCTIRNVISNLINQEIDEIYVIGISQNPHYVTREKLMEYYQKEQICMETRKTLDYMFVQSKGFSFDDWISGLPVKEDNIRESVKLLKHHPIIPKRLKVTGYLANESEKNMKQIF
jgi:carbonic anhydrase